VAWAVVDVGTAVASDAVGWRRSLSPATTAVEQPLRRGAAWAL
jgi:hypothetical protein